MTNIISSDGVKIFGCVAQNYKSVIWCDRKNSPLRDSSLEGGEGGGASKKLVVMIYW